VARYGKDHKRLSSRRLDACEPATRRADTDALLVLVDQVAALIPSGNDTRDGSRLR
jgi:hypothetical protein